MKVTINKIRVELQEVAEAHEMINSFFWGDFHRAWNEESLTYPLVCGYIATGGSLSKNLTNVPLTIVVADKVFKDYSSLDDTESDTLQVCRHIFNTLNMSPRWNALIRVNSASVEKFIDKGSDEIAGHILNMNVDIKDSYSICNLPMGDYDFESTAENGCAGVLIVNSDGTFNFTAPSGSVVDLPDTPVTVRNVSGDEVGSGDVPSVTGGTITVPDCPVSGDGTATLKDSDGNVLSTTPVPPETTVDIIAPDSTYLVEYENGTPIENGSILSGGSVTVQVPNPIVCENATAELLFDGELIDTLTIPSGGTDSFLIGCSTLLNAVKVVSTWQQHKHGGTYEHVGELNGKNLYQSKTDATKTIAYNGTKWQIIKTAPQAHVHNAADGNEEFPWEATWLDDYLTVSQATLGAYCTNGGMAYYNLVDSDGNVLSQGSISEGDEVNIEAPDTTIQINGSTEGTNVAGSTVDIQLSDGTNPVTPDSITKVGDVYEVVVPSGGGWVRNPDWLPVPEITEGEQVVYALFKIYEKSTNSPSLRINGNYSVDWGDGTITNHTSNSSANHTYDFSTSSNLTPEGYKQAWIKITPQSGHNITSINFNSANPVVGSQRTTNIVDIIVNAPNCTSLRFSGTSQRLSLCERVWIKEIGNITTLFQTFIYMNKLASIPEFDCSNVTSIRQIMYENRTNLVLPCDLPSCEDYYQAYYEPNFEKFHVNRLSGSCDGVIQSRADVVRSVIVDDASGVTLLGSFILESRSLEECILNGITVGFSISSSKMSAQALNDLFTSLGTAAGSQTIIVSGNPGAATCDTTIATAKGFTVTT